MQTLFISQDLWDVIENGYPVPESPEELATRTPESREMNYNLQNGPKNIV